MHRITSIAVLVMGCLVQNILTCKGQVPYKPGKEIVRGGQFKDLILPMPITKELTSENIWGAENVLPRDVNNGVEDSEWCYWGGNPVKGKDGKYHLAICRWKEKTGHWGWPESEVAHAISMTPIGPYKVTGTVLEKGHNPEVIQLTDGSYVLHISGALVYTSKRLEGPWELLGKLEINERGHKGLSALETNLTGVERKDGSILFFTKRGDVMISNTGLLGPYKVVSAHNYSRYTGYPEDPVIWKSCHQYHVIYNHAIEKKSVYIRSLDGIHWVSEPGFPYDNTVFTYTDGTKNIWNKFERPKVIQDEFGRATHLTLGVIDVGKYVDFGNDKHSSKHVVLPLEVERLVAILNTEPISTKTKEVKIRIKAENDFNPVKDIDVNSLRLGSSNSVNYGGGAKPIRTNVENGDLLVVFARKGMEILDDNYDLKLLGKSTNGSIIFAYALLPGFSEDPASLVTLPIKIEEKDDKQVLLTSVENFGLKNSSPCQVKIFRNYAQKREIIKELAIPSLEPYEEYKIEVSVNDNKNVEYEAMIINSKTEMSLWNKVDNSHYSIMYKGDWHTNKEGSDIYMGTEQVSTQKGASATFFFNGTQARCYGNLSKQMGTCEVYIDDNYMEEIDCFLGSDIHNLVLYQTPGLSLGLHKLELRVTGKQYRENDKGPVAIDAFSYR